jgi:hypothetical protein
MSPLSDAFFAPLEPFIHSSAHRRECPALSDRQWLHLGVSRVISDARSGRGFLQQFAAWLSGPPSRSLFFESLKSARRLHWLRTVSQRLAQSLPAVEADLPALREYALYAGDGHWHAAACHDGYSDERGGAVGHLYALNLRTRALRHLTLCTGPKEHDMGALKRLGAEALRLGEPTGRKVLWVWDRAGIDFRLWHECKHRRGIYFISRTKQNMDLVIIGQSPVADSPENRGVLADQYVQTSQHVMVRRVRYQAPGGALFEFITTAFDLEPGLIAWLYLRRWELEKVYDQLKNKLHESKAWASSATAKNVQAEFLCLAHNLLELYQSALRSAVLRNTAEERRAGDRRDRLRRSKENDPPRTVSSLLTELARPLQTSVKLLRWLRAHWLDQTPLNQSLLHLQRLYATL